jgi:hypothetical protein
MYGEPDRNRLAIAYMIVDRIENSPNGLVVSMVA